jgi:hypothetical protein
MLFLIVKVSRFKGHHNIRSSLSSIIPSLYFFSKRNNQNKSLERLVHSLWCL